MNAPAILAPADARKLAKIVGLLASDKGGEVVAAAAAGTRLLHAAGLRWSDVVLPAQPPTRRETASRPPRQPVPLHRAVAAACLAHAHRPPLTAWERDFLASLLDFRTISAKQVVVLDRLVARVRAAGGGT